VLLTSLLRAIWSRQEAGSHQGQLEQKMGNLAYEQALVFGLVAWVAKPHEGSWWHANAEKH